MALKLLFHSNFNTMKQLFFVHILIFTLSNNLSAQTDTTHWNKIKNHQLLLNDSIKISFGFYLENGHHDLTINVISPDSIIIRDVITKPLEDINMNKISKNYLLDKSLYASLDSVLTKTYNAIAENHHSTNHFTPCEYVVTFNGQVVNLLDNAEFIGFEIFLMNVAEKSKLIGQN